MHANDLLEAAEVLHSYRLLAVAMRGAARLFYLSVCAELGTSRIGAALDERARCVDALRSVAVLFSDTSADEAKSHSQDREKQWVEVQIKGLSAWVNSYLAQSKAKGVTKIEDLAQDMKNGVVCAVRALRLHVC